MVALQTILLGASGQLARLGQFLERPDWPFEHVWSVLQVPARIEGAALLAADEVGEPILEVTVARREKAPLIGLASTRLRVMEPKDGGQWRRFDELRVGDRVVLPERHRGWWGLTWGAVREIRSRPAGLSPIWPGTPAVAGTLLMERGQWGFGTPSGFVACRDDGRR